MSRSSPVSSNLPTVTRTGLFNTQFIYSIVIGASVHDIVFSLCIYTYRIIYHSHVIYIYIYIYNVYIIIYISQSRRGCGSWTMMKNDDWWDKFRQPSFSNSTSLFLWHLEIWALTSGIQNHAKYLSPSSKVGMDNPWMIHEICPVDPKNPKIYFFFSCAVLC